MATNNYFHTKQKTHIHKFARPNRFFYPSSFNLKIFARAGLISIAKIGYPQKYHRQKFWSRWKILQLMIFDITTPSMQCDTTVSIRTEVYPIIAFGISFNASLVVENHSLVHWPAIPVIFVQTQGITKKIFYLWKWYKTMVVVCIMYQYIAAHHAHTRTIHWKGILFIVGVYFNNFNVCVWIDVFLWL